MQSKSLQKICGRDDSRNRVHQWFRLGRALTPVGEVILGEGSPEPSQDVVLAARRLLVQKIQAEYRAYIARNQAKSAPTNDTPPVEQPGEVPVEIKEEVPDPVMPGVAVGPNAEFPVPRAPPNSPSSPPMLNVSRRFPQPS